MTLTFMTFFEEKPSRNKVFNKDRNSALRLTIDWKEARNKAGFPSPVKEEIAVALKNVLVELQKS